MRFAKRTMHPAELQTYALNLIMVASTRSNAVHIFAVQQDALSFLQISYPWLNTEDIFQNIDDITTLLHQIKDLNITQAAQADTMIEELFLEWEEFPPLSEGGQKPPTTHRPKV